jgi:serine/threonine-protein kinase RsbW
MSNKTYRLTLKSTFEESERIPDYISDLQTDAGLSDDETANLMLLASEAVTNAIEHGNKLDPEKEAELLIDISPDTITVTVTDEGEGFDPNKEIENPLDEENLLNVRGRGVFLLKELSDELSFLDDGRTTKFVIRRQS